ncbi:response regulator transcription factor [Accumulibacter sp.]|uniref:helix-turn-helix transcriptional regulator n=1 Tax=Accumulibacter sp. TaxID=2053492 RepID=UPI0025F09A09|nr:response regulator transcription factor [Accumulibacter sp.]MCM8611037.1 response regulator transcription factor [Accumulibacter sp.]MCM8635289.1 response regulator transcription factor [Accumulibacter sp.]MCM8639005.1 response regulator transcription factor [Accumulibacter sp.]
MRQVFLSADARQRDSWREAFPDLMVGSLDTVPADAAIIWVLLPAGCDVAELVAKMLRSLAGRPFVILADEPDEESALAALNAGAAGFCNGHAAPVVLRQVAAVVGSGGIWIGQGLMKRLLAATARLLGERDSARAAWRSKLTPREQEVALALARGSSNKEIARQFGISERTVKFHVSALFDKLAVRDRLQLSLLVNGVDLGG